MWCRNLTGTIGENFYSINANFFLDLQKYQINSNKLSGKVYQIIQYIDRFG